MAGECLRRILLPDDELFDAIFETTDRGTTAFDGLREMLGRDGCTQFAIPAGFWGRFDDNSEVLWREKKWVARFLGEVRGSQTFETTQIASPLAVHGATNRPSPAWRGALDELTRLPASDWRSPTLVADDSVLERYPSPVDGEVAIVGAAAGIVTRSLVALKSVDRHRHYNRDVNPWLYNASGDPEIRGNQCAERKYPK